MDLRSTKVENAIISVERRAEREKGCRKLYDIYVDRGVLTQVSAKENQIVYGRRGVGKTHLFHCYRDHALSSGNEVLFQIHDCSKLGSAFGFTSNNPIVIAKHMFRELLNDIATDSFESLSAIEKNDQTVSRAGSVILAFQDVINQGISADLSFNFRNLRDTLSRFLTAYGVDRLIIALDEWVAVPSYGQPFFAELLKRTFFTSAEIVVKIAAVTYQTKMATEYQGRIVGL